MDLLRQQRTPVRTSFTKTAGSLEDELRSTQPKPDSLVALLAVLEEKGEKLAALDKDILSLMQQQGCTTSDYEKEYETIDNYTNRLTTLLARGRRQLRRLDNGDDRHTSTSTEEPTYRRRKYRLPELELKKFSGELRDWLGFWGQFRKIHEDVDIATEDKFQYLLQATVANSRARQVVESFPPHAESYLKAVDSLKCRFGREDMLVEVYVRDLLRLVLNNAVNPKQKGQLIILYDQLESQLRALETLGVTTEKYASMLYPLVESSLPEDVLRTWERSRCSTASSVVESDPSGSSSPPNRLTLLMAFLRTEVEGEERINLARTSFGLGLKPENKSKKKVPNEEPEVPTAAGLFSGSSASAKPQELPCIFCEKQHPSQECNQASNISLEDKRKMISKRGSCFVCLKPGHMSRRCRSKHRCPICGSRHFAVMCMELPMHRQEARVTKAGKSPEEQTVVKEDSALANHAFSAAVLLQTLLVKLRGSKGDRLVRALLDTGSQRSYVSVRAATQLELKSLGKERIVHNLFGGTSSTPQEHNRYRLHLASADGAYFCNFEVLDQRKICGSIPKVQRGPWLEELKQMGIPVSDVAPYPDQLPEQEIDVLIGADVAGKLFTGRIMPLTSGPIAIQTRLGWTLMGKMPIPSRTSSATLVTSLLVGESPITNLWKLDCLGILDPVETKKREELEKEALDYFQKTVQRTPDGRYEVALPWLAGHDVLPTNRLLAERRLRKTVNKLRGDDMLEEYQQILHSWVSEGIIEEVPQHEVHTVCHYLPHRAVIKESSETTKIRPVFDASAREKGSPSLNDCLERGPNLIEKIPSILTRFRKGPIGIVSDIKKAFLQISMAEHDRRFLQFLWWEDGREESLKIYRHRRVVFGVSSSPFLLGATLALHLQEAPQHLQATASKLGNSFYVDNCVTSVNDEHELKTFIRESQELLATAQFELRGWHYSDTAVGETTHHLSESQTEADDDDNKTAIPVLGLLWDKRDDVLLCDVGSPASENEPVTKRSILSAAQRIFDPLGLVCPVTLSPRLLLQDIWKMKVGWDDDLPAEIKTNFMDWRREVPLLREVRIPRCLNVLPDTSLSLHIFCDASRKAYATCIFLRAETSQNVSIQLLQAKTRVAPLKSVTIPRMELLACCIGARLAGAAIKDLQTADLQVFYWSDSATALCWIKGLGPWGVFVENRVREICSLSDPIDWHYVPGNQNPADLPSRGCSVKQIMNLRWCEGPSWLYEPKNNWPKLETPTGSEEADKEKRKTVVSAHCSEAPPGWYHKRISSFLKIVRMIGWILRFHSNATTSPALRVKSVLQCSELEKAEMALWRMVQTETFSGLDDPSLRTLKPVQDTSGIIRLQTAIVFRKDHDNFRYPIVLPSNHPVVELLILWRHRALCHAGIHILMVDLRENFWILRARKTIRRTIQRCGRCRRFSARCAQVTTAPLPEDRIGDAAVFQVTGVDLAGPVVLKGSQKAWIVLFTCAVYRAVHLELVTSLSTDIFLQAFRRFVARRGRPSTVYSDNGTNFVGANNAMKNINWDSVQAEGAVQRIRWKFNPPAAAWWGGWWERLVRMMKELLRRVLGQASLHYEELLTVLCDCESVMNSRPLTYVSESVEDPEPLTPALFLYDVKTAVVPDIDSIDRDKLTKRARYCHKIRENFRQRFRSEYLGQLKAPKRGKVKTIQLNVGDVVLIEGDSPKRLDWRLARVLQVYPGRDGLSRVARLKTKTGEVMRPVQKLYPMEMQDNKEDRCPRAATTTGEDRSPCAATPTGQDQNPRAASSMKPQSRKTLQDGLKPTVDCPPIITRSGRVIKSPNRYSDI